MPDAMISLSVRARAGIWRVAVNDVALFETVESSGGSVTLPVAQFLQTGQNLLSAMLADEADPSAGIEVRIFAHRLGDPTARLGDIARLEFDIRRGNRWTWQDAPQTGIGTPGVVASGALAAQQQFQLALPLPQWAWLRSAAVAPGPGLRDSVIAHYRTIWEALDARAAGRAAAIVAERTAELRLALGAGAEDVPDDMGLGELFAAGAEAWPFDIDEAELELGGNGRLVRLRRWNTMPFLLLRNGGVGEYLDLWLRQGEQGWIVTR